MLRSWLAILLVCGASACERSPQPPARVESRAERLEPPSEKRADPGPGAKNSPRHWGEAAGLRYLELVRGGGQADDTLPMLVMIHGLGDKPRPELFASFETPVRIIMPQAPTPYGSGYAWFRFRTVHDDARDMARGIAGAAEQLARCLRELRRTRPTAGRAVVSGFSQGGMLSLQLALSEPELVELALPASGWLPEPLWPEAERSRRHPPIVALHGTADRVVPIDPTRRLIKILKRLGYDAELIEFRGVGHSFTAAMQRQLRSRWSPVLGQLQR